LTYLIFSTYFLKKQWGKGTIDRESANSEKRVVRSQNNNNNAWIIPRPRPYLAGMETRPAGEEHFRRWMIRIPILLRSADTPGVEDHLAEYSHAQDVKAG
jgi:hypothetical protein